MSRTEISHRIHRRWRLVSGGGALALALLLGVAIVLRGNTALSLDDEWMEEIEENRSVWFEVPSLLMNWLGGGAVATVLAVGIVVTLIVLKRRWTALYFAVTSVVSLALVQAMKALLGRSRPEDVLVHVDQGSFPSGHVANAATLAALLAIILWRWWVLVAGAAYVVIMALSRTYLGAHWLSDTAGGLLVGVGVAVILWAPFADRVLSERQALSKTLASR